MRKIFALTLMITLLACAIIAPFYCGRMAEVPTPVQQMEDTIPTSLKEEIKALNPKVIIFAHPIQEDSL